MVAAPRRSETDESSCCFETEAGVGSVHDDRLTCEGGLWELVG
jgi:hypothetical protein